MEGSGEPGGLPAGEAPCLKGGDQRLPVQLCRGARAAGSDRRGKGSAGRCGGAGAADSSARGTWPRNCLDGARAAPHRIEKPAGAGGGRREDMPVEHGLEQRGIGVGKTETACKGAEAGSHTHGPAQGDAPAVAGRGVSAGQAERAQSRKRSAVRPAAGGIRRPRPSVHPIPVPSQATPGPVGGPPVFQQAGKICARWCCTAMQEGSSRSRNAWTHSPVAVACDLVNSES